MRLGFIIAQLFYCAWLVSSKLECDPSSSTKKPDPNNPESYLYCNLEGFFSKRKCLRGKIFNADNGTCESVVVSEMANDDPFSQPFNQAPDDLCGTGIPLTILSAPVVCNPSVSSCPDGYVCRNYERTGTSYCCQGSSPPIDEGMCGSGLVTYMEQLGKPRSCSLNSSASCPAGFVCSQVDETTTRCCGKDLGCPYNSAAFIHPSSASMVECSPSLPSQCQHGFSCVRSTTLKKHICCSSSTGNSGVCPNGDTPLPSPVSCTASYPCPKGYSCSNGKCCPTPEVCPAGAPLGGGSMKCAEDNPCQNGYECITAGSLQYCCPSRENVCSLQRHAGATCASPRTAVTRYYFDITTGSCRSFLFSQCGGNANNFNSLDECEGFCLDTQCQYGQAYRVGAANAVCALTATNTCPHSHSCMSPVFGPSAVCCPSPELTCNEMVSAGTPCFGRSVTIQRYYFNPATRKCQPFQYYGCNGNGNNFLSLQGCIDHCLNAVESVCNGAAALLDPNSQPQRCSSSLPCPTGYECNTERFCCPTSETACSSAVSRGKVCSGSPLRSMWYFDRAQRKCKQFAYNGCEGTANRFTSRKACMSTCVSSSLTGQCPRGMTPLIEDGDTTVKTCTLNVMGTCPPSASCVRSTTNQPICCQTVTSCPDNRAPYVIPGSNSVVACSLDADECPAGNACAESSSVPGFYMCCSSVGSVSYRPSGFGGSRKEPNTLAALIRSISPCPGQLVSNGQTCTVNAVGSCPRNHLCLRDAGYENGSCCRTGPPKCSIRQHVPVFVSGTQVQICQVDIGGCPRDSRCMTSNIPRVSICCRLYNPQSLSNTGGDNVMARPNAQAKCRNGDRPFAKGNEVIECSFSRNDCPSGYKCEFSSTGQQVCCGDPESIRCPAGSSPFEYGGRPLACPPGSVKCPDGYTCTASLNPQYHLCCSTSSFMTQPQLRPPQCLRGTAYSDPALNLRQFCSPLRDTCPVGYQCMESDYHGQFICCTQGDLSEQFKGYCPPNQIPYVSREGYPSTCHMQLNPCPTTAPYVCIYSAMKQDSYCCAPADTTSGNALDPSLAASPMRKLGMLSHLPLHSPGIITLRTKTDEKTVPFSPPTRPFCCVECPSSVKPGIHYRSGPEPDTIPTAPPSSPYAGMSQTFPGGPIAPGMGPVAIPDPIPGVQPEQILPPSLAASMNANGNANSFRYGANRFVPTYPGLNGLPNGPPVGRLPVPLTMAVNQPLVNGQPDVSSQVVNQVLSQLSVPTFHNGGNVYGTYGSTQMVGGQHSNMRGQWSSPPQQAFSGCPFGSKALVRADRSVVTCNDQSCPSGFWCVLAEKEERFQCCSSSPILTGTKPSEPPQSLLLSTKSPSVEAAITPETVECPPGFFLVEGKCLKILFAGQKGCISNDQCSTREPNATCDSGYCVCPAAKPLVHGGKCVAGCPEGFTSIAGRCYDPTTVIFMDSVDERKNGTIGGYCLETLVEEKRCIVENSYCSEKTVTCQCKVGYTLNLDFSNKEDEGSCLQDESSKYVEPAKSEPIPTIDDELYFVDIGSNASDTEDMSSNSTLEDDFDPNRYLYQTDDLIAFFA